MLKEIVSKLLQGNKSIASDAWRDRNYINGRDRFVFFGKNKFEFVWDNNCLLVFRGKKPAIKIGLPDGHENWNTGTEYVVDTKINGTEYRFQARVLERYIDTNLVWQVRTHSRKRTEITYVQIGKL